MASKNTPNQNLELPFSFSMNFLRDHAGHIITDPKTAVTELIANAYDAGATAVDITWPDDSVGRFAIADNGTGMTEAEFNRRWRTLSYDRLKEQGANVEFPPGIAKRQRTAFGRNGKGRHAAFCFSDRYEVETRKDGRRITAELSITDGGDSPFRCIITSDEDAPGFAPGTTVSADLIRGLLREDEVREVIGTRFIVDPSFSILLNGRSVQLFDLQTLKTDTLAIDPYGVVDIYILDVATADRSSKLKGLTWWVNDRMVGEPSWEGLDGEGSILDGRTSEAKRFSFIIRADLLRDEVKHDWSGFHATGKFNAVGKSVRAYVAKTIYDALAENRKARKKAALDEHRVLLRELPEQSKQVVAQFVERVQEECPRLSDQDLARTVSIYAKLEQSRTGYDLLKQLAACSPDDLDGWNAIMQRWSAGSATLVLNELGERLTLISRLQDLINDRATDEVHELQPLFERGLWMFGPEYEAVDFRSNRGMAEVIRKFFGRENVAVTRNRPDFVALAESSIGAYGADHYAENGEAFGYRKVLVVELKRGGFTITQSEMDQARDYIKEIRAAGAIDKTTQVEAYILGSKMEDGLERSTMGSSTVLNPMVYDNLLTRAHARTFHLHRQIEAIRPAESIDPELREVLSFQEPLPMFPN
jgi:hypothetical protein